MGEDELQDWRVKKMFVDIYIGDGDGNLPLITRQKITEGRTSALEAYNIRTENRHEAKLNLILTAVVSCFGAIIVGIVLFLMHIKT